ncbi:MAG: DUF1552 domain-containing protein, partial [Myxococcota bacterium]
YLRGMAGAAIALPLYPSLFPSSLARANGAQNPCRLVTIYTANGHHIDLWTPTGSEREFTLSPVLAPLERHRNQLAILHHLEGNYGHFRGHAETLTGRPAGDDVWQPAGGPSLDQLLASTMRGVTQLPSLELGVDTGSSVTGIISFSEGGLPIPSVGSPRGAYDRLFNLASIDPDEADRRRQHKLSVLDFVMDDYRSLQGQLSAADRRVMDAHLTLLREHEAQLQMPIEVEACALPEGPNAPTGGSEYSFGESVRYHMDNIAAAFACDVTRVATVMIGRSGYSGRYTEAGVNDDFHEVAHGNTDNALAKYEAVDRWHAEQIAYLCDRLAAIPEGDGSVLDNTLIMWTSEIGLHDFSHHKSNHGVLLCGGAGNLLRTGRFLDMSGHHYHDLLYTLAHILGAQVQGFGESGNTLLDTLMV